MVRYAGGMEHSIGDGASITGIDLSAILVRDPAAQVSFYRDVLGIAPTNVDDGGRGAEFTLADGSTFGVWNQGGEGPESDGKVTFFAVGDAGAAVEAIRKRGGTVGELIESRVCRMAFGADPDDNGFVIHQRTVRDDDVANGHVAGGPASIVGLDIASVFVSDPARSIAFYLSLIHI